MGVIEGENKRKGDSAITTVKGRVQKGEREWERERGR